MRGLPWRLYRREYGGAPIIVRRRLRYLLRTNASSGSRQKSKRGGCPKGGGPWGSRTFLIQKMVRTGSKRVRRSLLKSQAVANEISGNFDRLSLKGGGGVNTARAFGLVEIKW